MRIPILHYGKDKKTLVDSYLLALFFLLVFGFYKNGILLYQNGLIKSSNMFLPIYFYAISVIVSLIVAIIMREDIRENILMGLVASCSVSINSNMLMYPIVLFIGLFITNYLRKKFTFNKDALIHMFLLLALLFGTYSYLNIGEKLGTFNYDLFDIFLGHCEAGIASSSLFMVLIGLIILSINKYYKKEIPISAGICFILTVSVLGLIFKKDVWHIVFNGSVYFSFVFGAANIYDSPSDKKGMVIYGTLIGFWAGLISMFNLYEAGFASILLMSLFIPIFNRLTAKKYLHR